MRKAIVFNCHYNGLSIIQEMGRNGVECIAMDCIRSIGTYSKYAKYVKCPDPLENEDLFIDFLYEFCKKQDMEPVLFPTNDHWACAISKNKDLLSKVSLPIIADWNTVNLVINKDKFYEVGQEKDYLTPFSWKATEVLSLPDDIFPIIAKPKYRRISSNEASNISKNMDRLRFTILNNKNELINFLNKEKEFTDKLIFQEYVNGLSNCMYTIGIYADSNSEVLGLFTGHKIRGYPADSGDCIVGELAKVPNYIIENTIRIIKDIKYYGIAEFEYKENSITGDYKLIEINPRSWSWIGITPQCGVSLPLIAYRDSCGENVNFEKTCLDYASVKYIKIIDDFLNCMIFYKKNYPNWHLSFFEWKNNIKADSIVYAEFSADDLLIGYYSIKEKLKGTFKSIYGKMLQK